MERVILVDEQDNPIGTEEKLRAHQDGGKLHRAFSVFVFNDRGELLLQRRARRKYHFGGLWTNTCCSHPRENETVPEAVHRKLVQEMGFDTAVEEALVFTYRAADADSGLTEHEFDHVFTGVHNTDPLPNPDEVEDWKWSSPSLIERDLHDDAPNYTPWFSIAFRRLMALRPTA